MVDLAGNLGIAEALDGLGQAEEELHEIGVVDVQVEQRSRHRQRHPCRTRRRDAGRRGGTWRPGPCRRCARRQSSSAKSSRARSACTWRPCRRRRVFRPPPRPPGALRRPRQCAPRASPPARVCRPPARAVAYCTCIGVGRQTSTIWISRSAIRSDPSTYFRTVAKSNVPFAWPSTLPWALVRPLEAVGQLVRDGHHFHVRSLRIRIKVSEPHHAQSDHADVDHIRLLFWYNIAMQSTLTPPSVARLD